MDHRFIQHYRQQQFKNFPRTTGVYVLRDWFKAALYVGASTDGLLNRCRRHLTSARSDLISSGRLCVSEIAFIDCYEIEDLEMLRLVEQKLIFVHNAHRPIFNVKIPITCPTIGTPQMITCQMIPDSEIERMKKEPTLVVEHHISMMKKAMDYIRTAKDNPDTRHTLEIRRSFLNYHSENLNNSIEEMIEC